MRVTAQLALSQLKLNRKRTLGSISAILLSTALVTSVMCFATSGNRMLTDFLGTGYGNYGGAYFLIIAIPALILALLISAMSVTVISNIFAASANKRIQEFGILKCVGGTRKQIKESVIYESLWLCMIGIPLGLLVGTVTGFLGVKIAGHYISSINELSRSIIMRPFSFALSFHVSIWTYVFAGVCSFFIVIRSAGKPAKKVGEITAIECIKGLGANKNLKNTEVRDGFVTFLFGYEGALSYKNIKRNKAGYQSTIRALSMGILLLLLTGGLGGQGKAFRDLMNPDSKEMMVDYCSIRDYEVNAVTGRIEEKIAVPISAQTYNEITGKLSEYGGIQVYGIGNDSCTYHALPDAKDLSDDMKEAPGIFDENGETTVSLVAVNEDLYQELCARAGAAYGSNLLINHYSYNHNGRIKEAAPFRKDTGEITLINAAEEKTRLRIGGILQKEDLTEKGFRELSPNPVRIVVPNIDARYFDWYCLPDDEQAYTEYARKIMDEYYPLLTEDSYVEQGYTVRISRADTMVKMLNVAIVLAEIVMYGFVLLLILMGFASVVSTITANIRIRSHEFAILKSIGMTSASLRKMIYIESILCMLKASAAGMIPGIIIPFVINLPIRRAFPVLYHIPWGTLVSGMMILISVVMLITCMEVRKLKNKNLIEEIRMDII